jgi:hypothetical protein
MLQSLDSPNGGIRLIAGDGLDRYCLADLYPLSIIAGNTGCASATAQQSAHIAPIRTASPLSM